MKSSKQNMKVLWAGRVVTALASFPFLMSGVMKLTANPQVMEGVAHMGLPESLIFPIGILEIACVLIYLVPQISVLGAVLLTGYLGGAILTHLRISENVVLPVIIGLLVWLGIYLREPRLHDILPLRKGKK